MRASQRAKPASPEREFQSKFRQDKKNFEIISKFFTHIPPLTKGLALGSSYVDGDGGDKCRAQVKNLKEKVTKIVARSDDSRAGRAAYQISKRLRAIIGDFCQKEKFDKKFHHFQSLFGL